MESTDCVKLKRKGMRPGCSVFLFACLTLEGWAATLVNNVTIYPYDSPSSSSFAIDYHGYPEAVFTPKKFPSTDYIYSSIGIAESYSFYNVFPGVLMDARFVERIAPLGENSILSIGINQSKYIGYWADIYPKPFYGWVRITHTSTGLVASESATSVGTGIYVGSFEEIPETSASVLGLAAMTLLLRRRRITISQQANRMRLSALT